MNLPFLSVRSHMLLIRRLEDPVVLDIGSNHGEFSRHLKALLGGTYRLYEPNPELVATTPVEAAVTVTQAAITDTDGKETFNVASNDEGSSLLTLPTVSEYDCVKVDSAIVPTISLNRLLAELPGRVDLIKMDIEGAEVAALRSVDLGMLSAQVGQLAVEFHSAPVFGFDIEDQVVEVIERVKSAGFEVLDFTTDRRDVLFLNRRLLGLSALQCRCYRLWAARGYPGVLQARDFVERARGYVRRRVGKVRRMARG